MIKIDGIIENNSYEFLIYELVLGYITNIYGKKNLGVKRLSRLLFLNDKLNVTQA